MSEKFCEQCNVSYDDELGDCCPPPPCSACAEAHAILDADASKIIRNAKDGYPEGRDPRELTLAERVNALCIYAADWKRWCEEQLKEAKLEAAQPALTTCPKCGSKDITRQHREPGDRWRTYASVPKGKAHESRWIFEDYHDGHCKKECIASVCRCCGFRWECDPLPDDSNAVKWQAKTILEPIYDDDDEN